MLQGTSSARNATPMAAGLGGSAPVGSRTGPLLATARLDAFEPSAVPEGSSAAAFSLRMRLLDNPATAAHVRALDLLLSSSAWLQMNETERAALIAIAGALPLRPVERLAANASPVNPLQALAQLCISERIFTRDRAGATILSHLSSLYRLGLGAAPASVFNPEGGVTAALSALIEQLANPPLLSQGDAGTCTVTSLSDLLLRTEPAVYTRIICELLVRGEARLSDGSVLTFDVDGTEPSLFSHDQVANIRSPGERALQSALMQLGNQEVNYSFDRRRRSEPEAFEARCIEFLPVWLQIMLWLLLPVGLVLFLIRIRVGGLSDGGTARVAEALFGRQFRVLGRGSLSEIEMHLDANGRATAPMVVGVDDFSGGGHALTLEGIDRSGAVPALICRNPWGARAASATTATEAYGPGFEGVSFVDAIGAVLRIPLDSTLGRSVSAFIVPASASAPVRSAE